jgi:adenine-specific DNA-methyltransferase
MEVSTLMSEKRFDEKLIELLKTNFDFVDDTGELRRENIKNRAWDFDRELINLLLTDETIAPHFFDEVSDGRFVFNNKKFVEYFNSMNLLAKSHTRFKNKVGLTIDDKYLRERGEVSLVFPYKDCVLEGGQTKEDDKRNEVFFNELIAKDEISRMFDPKVLTNWKRHTTTGEEKVTEIKRDDKDTICENLIIKGNNLIALSCLEQQFRSKVKLIYIDPPYNTGNDSFGYNDSFNHSSSRSTLSLW